MINRTLFGRRRQALRRLCQPFFFIIALWLLGISHPYSLWVCEASTVTAGRTAIDWAQRRRDIEQRLLSRVQLARNAISGTKVRDSFAKDEFIEGPVGLAGYRDDYADGNSTLPLQQELKHGFGQAFVFQRFQSPASIRKALQSVRSASSFKWYEGKDGRKGYVSSTKLGGDYVLAESEQIAVDCKAEHVLRVYLSGELQTRWNTNNCEACIVTKMKKGENHPSELSCTAEHQRIPRRLDFWSSSRGDGFKQSKKPNKVDSETSTVDRNGKFFYLQDLFLKSQRVIRSQTGPMRYQQIIEIDKVGKENYSILVRLLKNEHPLRQQEDPVSSMTATDKKPFESLEVYVGLEQMGSDVKIYAAGVFEVNRNVVPKIIVFDTSGFAGSIAGKGTLWLAGYFEKRRNQKRRGIV